MSKPNSPWPGIIRLFPARESLVSDIPAGDRKNAKLFYSVHHRTGVCITYNELVSQLLEDK
jgi:hypothetical protein